MLERINKRGAALAASALLGAVVLLQVGPLARAQGARRGQDFALIQRGRYLTTVADCSACHTDPETNLPFAGGRPILTPFGTVLAANITPDLATGIGTWSDAQFIAALREGRMPNGARLYPAMPYVYYAKMSNDDVLAIRAFLETLPPIHNAVATDQLPFPFDIRMAMRFWDLLYFKGGQWAANPSKSGMWNRGAYLVEGPGHCQACHTPKNLLGGDERRRPLQGYMSQGWFAPNITADTQRGLSEWTVADIASYLKSGHNRFVAAAGPMAEEVADSSSLMTDSDLQAIAIYLKDRSAQNERLRPISTADPRMVAGAAIYEDLCSACHRSDGSGVAFLIPNLALSNSVASTDLTTLLRVVLVGAQSVATHAEPTGPSMPGFRWQLTNAQVAAVLTYIRNSWGHAARPVDAGDVSKARAQLARANP